MLITVSGVIGCGKSSLVQGLVEKLGATAFFEPLPDSGNFMLNAYYVNPEKYAYSMQTLLLALRFQTHQEAQWRSARGELCVIDAPIFSDRVFLEVQKKCGYIDNLEYRAYETLCSIHYPFLQYPDFQLHVDVPLEVEVERIKSRSRECESGIDVSYLQALHNAHSDLLPHLKRLFPVVMLDGRKSKAEVLQDAVDAIRTRQGELAREASGWPCYKKNQGYPSISTNKSIDNLDGLQRYETN